MTLFLLGTAFAAYLGGGFLTWLISAVEMLGDTSNNSYLDSLRNFSKRNVTSEVLTFVYLILAWPLHQALKAASKK